MSKATIGGAVDQLSMAMAALMADPAAPLWPVLAPLLAEQIGDPVLDVTACRTRSCPTVSAAMVHTAQVCGQLLTEHLALEMVLIRRAAEALDLDPERLLVEVARELAQGRA